MSPDAWFEMGDHTCRPDFETQNQNQNPSPSLSLSPSHQIKAAMEAILRDCVQHSLRDFMYRNAIFLCERLCAEYPSEVPFIHLLFTLFFLLPVCLVTEKSQERKNEDGKFEMKFSLLLVLHGDPGITAFIIMIDASCYLTNDFVKILLIRLYLSNSVFCIWNLGF